MVNTGQHRAPCWDVCAHCQGFTDTAFKVLPAGALDDYAPWQQSRLVLSVNPLTSCTCRAPAIRNSPRRSCSACHVSLGERCVFDNHDLNAPLAEPAGAALRLYSKELRRPIEFQTANKSRRRTFPARSCSACRSGASAIELYQDFRAGSRRWPNATAAALART